MVLLHTGKVLFWRGSGNTAITTYLWDPDTPTNMLEIRQTPARNLFCSGHATLADGRVLAVGGGTFSVPDSTVSIFDPASETWAEHGDMAFNRWYPTVTTLPDGRALITSGREQVAPVVFVELPELYDPVADTMTVLTDAPLVQDIYPNMFVLPDGRALAAGPGPLSYALDVDSQTWDVVAETNYNAFRGTAAMYSPGKIVKVGGGTLAFRTGEVLDMNAPDPSWRTIPRMNFPRRIADLVLLPDGKSFVVGGSIEGATAPECAMLAPEIWNPDTESWTTAVPHQRPRVYHTAAILLPDGRVLVAGGENSHNGGESNGEIYSPPYLFKGPRPEVGSAPTEVGYGALFDVVTPDASSIGSVAMLRPGSVTHNFDHNQRYVPLAFTQHEEHLSMTAPANGAIAPPGYYMLFLVNANGVPSLAHWIRLTNRETCDDGIDNDSDGAVDWDDPDCFCVDADGDGFADCNPAVPCNPVGANCGDCDDERGDVHPGAEELCNGLDDDCDDQIDESPDIDGDGFGMCVDCDETDASINPGAVEACADGIDNNCDGIIDECDDGLYCNGVETCSGGVCLPGTSVICDDGITCTNDFCNDAAAACEFVADDSNCSNGLFCDGEEQCDPEAGCLPAPDLPNCDDGNPCTLDSCDESAGCVNQRFCVNGVLETTSVTAGETPVTVNLTQHFSSPVVVCTVNYANNTAPVIPRVSNVQSSTFELRLQNPGDLTAPVDDLVHCLIVEEGVWSVNGVLFEAKKYLSAVTDHSSSWVGEQQTYGRTYFDPVVVGQVMSENDPRWSAFWSRGGFRAGPPTTNSLWAGKHVGGDPARERADETVGLIVFEAGHGTIDAGVAYEAGLGPDTIFGVARSASYTFATEFSTTPTVWLASQAGMDGVDGAWAQTHGSGPATSSTLRLSVDEDQVEDLDRDHTNEQVAYIVFGETFAYPGEPPCDADADCDDGDPCTTDTCDVGLGCLNVPMACDDGSFCNGEETCDNGVCVAGADPCDDEVDCTDDSCNEETDSCAFAPDHGQCTNNLMCDGEELCQPGLGCTSGIPPDCDDGDPCTDDSCEEDGGCLNVPIDCISGVLETRSVTAGATPVTVHLARHFASPVVVCTVDYANNTTPVVTRVSNVASSSFDVRLQSPGDLVPPADDLVHCLVAEEGTWSIDGVHFEAQKYLSSLTDSASSWVGRQLAYGRAYSSPVVLGQVMSENDSRWSAFWSHGGHRGAPPSTSSLWTGKHVGGDPMTDRADETIGVIVFESGHGTIESRVAYEAGLGADTVTGVSTPTTYTFARAFTTAPSVLLVSQAAMDGIDGSWAQTHGTAPATATTLRLSLDEDQLADAERNHTTEQVAYLVFSEGFASPSDPDPPLCLADADCDDGDSCTLDRCDEDLGCTNEPLDCLRGVLESQNVTAGATPVTVSLAQRYSSPVVVCTVNYANNAQPVVARVSNVLPTGFQLRLQNPGDLVPPAEDDVHCLIVEEGVWSIHGARFEAQKYLSSPTDSSTSWVGERQTYGQAYSDPVVLGQVMTENDPRWSVFWSHGGVRTSSPTAGSIWTGKHVGGDPVKSRTLETVGFLVFESGHGTLPGGVAYEAGLSPDAVVGIASPTVHPFDTPFTQPPLVVVASQSGMDGTDGAWAQTIGPAPATATSLRISVDEDQVGDNERTHTTEQVAYVAFGSSVAVSSNHRIRLEQLMAGANGRSDVQFVEIKFAEATEALWGPQGAGSESLAALTFHDGTGAETARFEFPGDPPVGPPDPENGGHSVLVATEAFVGLTGLVADFVMPPLISALDGMVCFTSGAAGVAPPVHHCLSYGNYQGGSESDGCSLPTLNGPAAPVLPVAASVPQSLNRFRNDGPLDAFQCGHSNADFQLVPPQARNSAGSTVMIPARSMVDQGRDLFVRETFAGNGRTCGTCHVAADSFALTPANVAARFEADPLDPLFIAENEPALAALENTCLLREGNGRALVLENVNGFENDPVFRKSPHLLNIELTAPYGLSGDFADLRSFSENAVRQHFPKTLSRNSDPALGSLDFRLPTTFELEAMEEFMNTIRFPADGNLDLDRLVAVAVAHDADPVAVQRGRDLFMGVTGDANCMLCHSGPTLSDADGQLGVGTGNEGFDIGIGLHHANEDDGCAGGPGDPDVPLPVEFRDFSTSPLLGVANTAPFFHDNSALTLREAVAHYGTHHFSGSSAGVLLEENGFLIQMSDQDIDDITAFLEAISTIHVNDE